MRPGSVSSGLRGVLALVAGFFAVSLASPHAGAANEGAKIVAVLPFESPNDHSHGMMGHNAQPTFVTELVKSKKVRVVDEKRLDAAMRRFDREKSGHFDERRVREIGKFLKADYVVSGQVSFTGDAYTMTVHVTNIDTLELEMAEDVDFRNEAKFRVAVRMAAKKIAGIISGEGSTTGKHEAFLNVDARHFYDTAEACIEALKGLDAWVYEGEIDSEDSDNRTVHVKLRSGKPRPGMPLQVFDEGVGENDRPIGVVYVAESDEGGSGFVARFRKKGDFGLGSRVSNARYRYRIAIGRIEDEAEDNAQLVEMFRDKLLEKLEESKEFEAKTDTKVATLAADLGRGSTRKERTESLSKLGVDFILEGKLLGDPGRRRADFKVISAFTGEAWATLKFETRI